MFRSATFKLTAWYAGIVVVISLLFSVLIFVLASSEVNTRINSYLERTTNYSDQKNYQYLHDLQVDQARHNLLGALLITNLCLWLAGGILSHYLAKRTLQPIEEAHDAQSRFVSDASHELRTPLATMKVELEVALRDAALNKDDMRELLASNLEEVNKLTKLSQTLLKLSQLDHGSIKKEKLALGKIAASVTKRFKNDRIVLSQGSKPLYVQANKDSVEELLMILIDNALKYSPSGSKIDIELRAQKDLAGFAITNTGEGIAPQVLPHIFDRFYRADTSRTSGDKKGYGLGLSLAKKIVELHNGELTVTSAPHQATTFVVLLPIPGKAKSPHTS